MRLYFYGGAESVTGANYLLEAGGKKILVDCGLFQGSRFSEELNYQVFNYDPAEVDYLLITHSHTDHIGRIPKLVKDGFHGTIITTEPTEAITGIALYDTLDKITEEAKHMGHPPLYHKSDIVDAMDLFRSVRYRVPVELGDQITVTFHNASHILGSALIEFVIDEGGTPKRLVFTGDLGNPPAPLLNPIDYVEHADYLVTESAYGSRIHEDREKRKDILRQTIQETVTRGGVVMIPSFAIERTQELLLEIDSLFEQGMIPKVPFFVDSPLAIKMTHVYGQFSHYFNPEALSILKDNKGLFQFPWLKFTPSVDESKKINAVPGSKIIIAGSGMSQGGRIVHHESRYLSDPNSTILFVGYQVKGSLGRRILDGEKNVRIFGQPVAVRCHVKAIGGYSAHADQKGLLQCIEHAKKGNTLKNVFIVQGESESAEALAQAARDQLGVTATVPTPNQVFEL